MSANTIPSIKKDTHFDVHKDGIHCTATVNSSDPSVNGNVPDMKFVQVLTENKETKLYRSLFERCFCI